MATNEPLLNFGANIVWSDINPETGNIDPRSVRRKITNRTKAIVGVHWAGQPFDIAEINELAQENGIKVIEDAAHALDARYENKPIGSHSDFVCFSFQAIKHLTTADGGCVACRSKKDAERVRRLRWFGLDRAVKGIGRWEQDIPESGYKFHMNNLNAVIGLEQMKTISSLIGRHKENGRFYDENIEDGKVEKLREEYDRESSYWIYSLLTDDREEFREYLAENGISSDWVHVRNDRYSCLRKFSTSELPGCDYFCDRLINIPVGWWLTKEDREYIVNIVNEY